MDYYKEQKYKIDELEEAAAHLLAAAQELRLARKYEQDTGSIDLTNFAKVEGRLTDARKLTESALRQARQWVGKNLNLPSGKERFVDDLTWRIRDDVIRKYIPHMPAEWEGIHLRLLLHDAFESETRFHNRRSARRAITTSDFYSHAGRV